MFQVFAYCGYNEEPSRPATNEFMPGQLPINDLRLNPMQRFAASDGGQVAYRDTGSGQPPLMLLHGWSLDHSAFNLLTDQLASQFRIIAPDFRGHGQSDPLAPGQDLRRLSQDVAELADALKLENLVVVGWSMGAMVLWGAWPALRDRLAGCVVIDMVPRLLNDASWQYGLRNGEDAGVFDRSVSHMRSDWEAYTRLFVPRIFKPHADQEPELDSAIKTAQSSHPDSMAQLWRSMAEQDFRSDLAHFDVPTLVVNGRHSQLYKAEAADWLARQLPDAERAEMNHSGHAPVLEEPEQLQELIAHFVRKLTLDINPERKSQEENHESPR